MKDAGVGEPARRDSYESWHVIRLFWLRRRIARTPSHCFGLTSYPQKCMLGLHVYPRH